MNDYRPDTPRAAFALGAVGLMALTLGALVVAPAVLDSGFAPEMTLASASPPATEVTITPARIEVVGVRQTAAVTQAGEIASLGKPFAANVAWALPHSEPCRPES